MSLAIEQAGWLWLLVPAVSWLVLLERRTRRGSAWRGLVDDHLLPHLLVEPGLSRRRILPLALASVALAAMILALAGIQVEWRGQAHALATPLLIFATLVGALGFRRGWLT